MQLELFQRNGVKKLENKIHIYELDCYKNATEEQKKRMRVRKDRYFDLEGLPSEAVRKLLEDFVWERGKKLAPSSLASEILYFNNIRNFLIEKNIKILRYEDENKIILQLKSWMMEKGYALTSKKYRSVYEIVATETPGIIKHMKKILRYSQKDGGCLEQERDVWELDKFEFPLRSNPIKNVKTINFKGISQITIRKEVKTVIFMHLKYMAIGSIMAEMVATKRFCRYLELRYPKIISLLDLTRDIMESYLIYLQTEAKERKNYRSDLYGLRRVVEDVGNHYDRQDIKNLSQAVSICKLWYAAFISDDGYNADQYPQGTAGLFVRTMCLHGGYGSWILWKTCIFFFRSVENFRKEPFCCNRKLSFCSLNNNAPGHIPGEYYKRKEACDDALFQEQILF